MFQPVFFAEGRLHIRRSSVEVVVDHGFEFGGVRSRGLELGVGSPSQEKNTSNKPLGAERFMRLAVLLARAVKCFHEGF